MNRWPNDQRNTLVRTVVLSFLALAIQTGKLAEAGWTISQLTDNSTDDKAPAISGTNVVWDASGEIHSNFAGKLANRSNAWGIGSYVDVSGTTATWQDYDGEDWEIYTNFGGQLTDNSNPDGGLVEDRRSAISGGNVVWESNGGIESNFAGHIADSLWSWEPYWPMGHYPAISGTNVVWQDFDGEHWQICSNFAGQLTTETIDHKHPAISGTNVVWETPTGIESNFAGRLADTQSWSAGMDSWTWEPGSYPAISGTNVVWQDFVDGQGWMISSNFAGWLTSATTSDMHPDISGMNVVWQGWDGSDWEIYMGTYTPDVIPAPGTILLAGLGAGLVGWRHRRRTL